MKVGQVIISLVFVAALASAAQGQPERIVVDLDRAIDDVEIEGDEAYKHISEIFASLDGAIAMTESLAVILQNNNSQDMKSLDDAIILLRTEVLSVFHSINSSKNVTRALLDTFSTSVLSGHYKLDEFNDIIREERAKNKADRAAVVANETNSTVASLRLGYIDKTAELLLLLDDYVDTAQVRVEHVRRRISLTEADIDLFFIACEEHEQFLRYQIFALQMYRDVETFLNAMEAATGFKDIMTRSLQSVILLNDETRKLIETRMTQIRIRETDSMKEHKE